MERLWRLGMVQASPRHKLSPRSRSRYRVQYVVQKEHFKEHFYAADKSNSSATRTAARPAFPMPGSRASSTPRSSNVRRSKSAASDCIGKTSTRIFRLPVCSPVDEIRRFRSRALLREQTGGLGRSPRGVDSAATSPWCATAPVSSATPAAPRGVQLRTAPSCAVRNRYGRA